MTNEEILKKAIEKAVDGEYEVNYSFKDAKIILDEDKKMPSFFWEEKDGIHIRQTFDIIFSHDFAKAFWGEDELENYAYKDFNIKYEFQKPVWQMHLQQMVLEEDPIKYLEQYLQ